MPQFVIERDVPGAHKMSEAEVRELARKSLAVLNELGSTDPVDSEAYIDGTARVEEPEILIYEPQRDGSLKFVGIEFVVHFTASATAPSLFGLDFHRNEDFQLWVLAASPRTASPA